MPRQCRIVNSSDLSDLKEAASHLQRAARLLRIARCDRLAAKVRSLQKSTEGAYRHAEGVWRRKSYPSSLNSTAIGEGWLLGWSDSRDRWEIQRDDEQARFATDADALEHVQHVAAAGSEFHRTALACVSLVDHEPDTHLR